LKEIRELKLGVTAGSFKFFEISDGKGIYEGRAFACGHSEFRKKCGP